MKLPFLIFAAFLLILANAIFVAAEFAIVRVRRTRLEELAGQGKDAAKRAILLIDHMSEYLAVTQIGVTAASLGVGWIGQDAFFRLLLLASPLNLLPHAVVRVAAATIAFFLITMMHVVLGELVPKNLAVQRAEQLLLLLVRPLQLLHTALGPLHGLFETLSSWILRWTGQQKKEEQPLTEGELKLLLMDSHEEGVLTEGEAKIIIRAFEFADKKAAQIMIPAERVDHISLARPFGQNLEIARKNMRGRLPLCRTGLDSVMGIVSMNHVWPLLLTDESNNAFEQAALPLIKIPANLSQDGVLRLLQQGHIQMGVVRDRADQKTLGIVTLEDVLESLVGDVREAPPRKPAAWLWHE